MLFNPYSNTMNNVTPNTPMPSMMSPYQVPQNTNKLPPQQILQANGKGSIDALQMSPNSSVLIMDSTSPIVWMCISDGLGNVSSTPYDISPHIDKPPVSMDNLEQRLSTIEDTLRRMEDINNARQSYDSKFNGKQNGTDYGTNKKSNEHHS